MSEEHWKLEKDLCRCCLSEGSFKNLAEPCAVPGVGNIEYSEMLLESLDVNITPVAGSLCASTFTICDECILRLQDACIFKRQVLTSEKRFRDLYSRNVFESHSKELAVKKEALDSDNEDAVKMELEPDDDDFRLEYDDHDDNKSDIELDLQAVKKAKTKKPKGKEKPKPKKRAVRPRKPAEAEPGTEAEGEAEPKAKKDMTEENRFTTLEAGGTVQYSCNMCEKTFRGIKGVCSHIDRTHTPVECPICSSTLPGQVQLTKHKYKEHPKLLICGVCNVKCRGPSMLNRHQRNVHMKERDVPCPQCDAKFFCQQRLRRHLVMHFGEKIFDCGFCKKKFKRKITRDIHEMIHKGEKNKACSICDARFVQKASLNYHMLKHHPSAV